jgi:dCMP deaminase
LNSNLQKLWRVAASYGILCPNIIDSLFFKDGRRLPVFAAGMRDARVHAMERPSWDEYFMEMAVITAKRSTCLRRHVGAVIVQDKHIMATGYNGAPKGIAHCEERGGCYREKMGVPSGERHELCLGLHAEQNAIVQAASLGQSVDGATMYITHQPCVICAKMIINAGIKKVIVKEGYPDRLAVDILAEAGLKIIMVDAL